MSQTETAPCFALLAPVPLPHIRSALEQMPGAPYVAFGSQKYELFERLDQERRGARIPALIYASHDQDRAEPSYVAEWFAWYVGSTTDQDEKFDDQRKGRRPPSTAFNKGDDASNWAVFWRVTGLQRCPEGKSWRIGDLYSYRTGAERKDAAPFGPERIELPFGLWRPDQSPDDE